MRFGISNVGLIFTVMLMALYRMSSADIRYPADAGVIDVTQAPYFAKGDGVTDDTAAINAALRDWNGARTGDIFMSPTVFFPKGTYLVSGTLIPMNPSGKTDQCSIRILGESREETIIRLKDQADGFQNPAKPKYVLKTGNRPMAKGMDGGQPNTGFGNYIQNLTVDVGRNNPGAVGIRYDVSNWGTMEHVNIVSPDGAGYAGLLFYTVCGSGYVKDVHIQGFQYGVYFDDTAVNNIVFEHLSLQGQTVCGLLNRGKSLQIRDLKSRNDVPAVETRNPWAATVLVDADLMSSNSTAEAAVKIEDNGFAFVRNISTKGYRAAVSFSDGNSRKDLKGPVVDEWVSQTIEKCASTGAMSLNLPVKESPEYQNNDFSRWVNVQAFGATPNDDSNDDAPAIQAAIDSGKEIVYFPQGKYQIATPIVVRGAVKKMDGLFSMLTVSSGNRDAEIRIEQVNGDFFIIENLTALNIPFVHNSSSAVVVRHKPNRGPVLCGPNASGDLFIEDAGPHIAVTVSNGVHAWVRQINRESEGFTNDGSTVWVFGDNVEDMHNNRLHRLMKKPFKTIHGGRSEILGGAIDVLQIIHPESSCALFETEDSQISVVYAGESRTRDGKAGNWGKHVLTTQSNRVETIVHEDLISVPLSSGGSARFILPPYISK